MIAQVTIANKTYELKDNYILPGKSFEENYKRNIAIFTSSTSVTVENLPAPCTAGKATKVYHFSNGKQTVTINVGYIK